MKNCSPTFVSAFDIMLDQNFYILNNVNFNLTHNSDYISCKAFIYRDIIWQKVKIIEGKGKE